MKLITPKNRIIVCLEQCATEWCNTVSRPLVQRVDPNFSRTILVNTKFDNRVKELRDKNSADGYLTGENLPEGVKPFLSVCQFEEIWILKDTKTKSDKHSLKIIKSCWKLTSTRTNTLVTLVYLYSKIT